MTLIVRGIFWFGLYVFLVTFPLLAAVLAAPRGGSPSFLANVGAGANPRRAVRHGLGGPAMNHRIVSAVVGLVFPLFAGAAVLFGLGMTPRSAAQRAPGAPPVPHGTTGAYLNCAECHAPGRPAVAMPATHRSFREGTCVICHHATG